MAEKRRVMVDRSVMNLRTVEGSNREQLVEKPVEVKRRATVQNVVELMDSKKIQEED